MAKKMYKWDKKDRLDFDLPGEMRIAHGDLTIDGNPRSDVQPRIAMVNRRVFGYVVDVAGL